MRYMGGKTSIANHIAPIINRQFMDDVKICYIEPFLGMASIFSRINAPVKIGSDIQNDVIAFWQALVRGWQPPSHVTRALYESLKSRPETLDHIPHYRAFLAYGCSFCGKKWDTYATSNRKGAKHNFATGSRNSSLRKVDGFGECLLFCDTYDSWRADEDYSRCVFYCDPSYRMTTKYKAIGYFDYDAFYNRVLAWRNRGATVFVSEYDIPSHWLCDFDVVWERKVKSSLSHNRQYPDRVEKLFKAK